MNSIKKYVFCVVCTATLSSPVHAMLTKSPQIPLMLTAIYATTKIPFENKQNAIKETQYSQYSQTPSQHHKIEYLRSSNSKHRNHYKNNHNIKQPLSKR